MMLAGYGVGNNCLFIFDLLTSSLNEKTPPRIIRSGARRLNTKILSTKDKYTNILENLVLRHRLTERMVAAHNESSRIVLVNDRTEIIYQEGVQ